MPELPSKSRHPRERGSALVEFTFVMLPLFGFLFLTLDLAWMIFAWASLQEGVREGVRFAITNQSDASIRAVVKTYSFGFIPDATATGPIQIHYYSALNPAVETGSNCQGNVVKIISAVSLLPMAPVWRDSKPLNVTASAADIVEPNPKCVPR